MQEAQELHCHECGRYVRFTLDLSIDGNYILDCPVCEHKHYRIVRDGRITDTRWGRDPSQGQWTPITASSTSATSSYTDYGGTTGDGSSFLHDSWCNSSSTVSY